MSGWRDIKPECRFCGTYVQTFGFICVDCFDRLDSEEQGFFEGRVSV